MSTKTVCSVESRNWLILGAVSSAFEQMEESAMIDRTSLQHEHCLLSTVSLSSFSFESTCLDVDGSTVAA